MKNYKVVYVKMKDKILVEEVKDIKIEDIAEIIGDEDLKNEIEKRHILTISSNVNKMYEISLSNVIKAINNMDSSILVHSIGEKETIIKYLYKKEKQNKVWQFCKIVFVSFIVFFGGAVAIMTFHTDVSMPEIHKQIFETFMGVRVDKPLLVQIPYSIGIGLGIILFFNSFTNNIDRYPTPLEIEISKYDADTLIATKEKIENNDSN